MSAPDPVVPWPNDVADPHRDVPTPLDTRNRNDRMRRLAPTVADERHDGPRGLDSRGHRPPANPARQFSDLARSLQAEPDLDQTLRSIVSAAVVNMTAPTLPGSRWSPRTGH